MRMCEVYVYTCLYFYLHTLMHTNIHVRKILIELLKIGTKRTINHLHHIKPVEMLHYGGKYINAEKIKSEVFRGFLYKNSDTSRETE